MGPGARGVVVRERPRAQSIDGHGKAKREVVTTWILTSMRGPQRC